MKVHLLLPDNTSEVVGFWLIFGRRAFKCQAPDDKTCWGFSCFSTYRPRNCNGMFF